MVACASCALRSCQNGPSKGCNKKSTTNAFVPASGFSRAARKAGTALISSSLILIRFQDEPNYGRVEAWEDHGGSTGEQ